MTSLGIVFLGLIALSSVVQAIFLIGLARGGRRLAQRLDAFQDRLDREIRPALEHVTRVSRNMAEISDTAVLQARRVDLLLADTVEKIEEATSLVRRMIVRPLGPLVDIAAFLKGLRRGIDVYHQLRGFDRQRRPPRHGEEDEHLFI